MHRVKPGGCWTHTTSDLWSDHMHANTRALLAHRDAIQKKNTEKTFRLRGLCFITVFIYRQNTTILHMQCSPNVWNIARLIISFIVKITKLDTTLFTVFLLWTESSTKSIYLQYTFFCNIINDFTSLLISLMYNCCIKVFIYYSFQHWL